MQAWAERKEPACNMMLHKVLNQMSTKEFFFLLHSWAHNRTHALYDEIQNQTLFLDTPFFDLGLDWSETRGKTVWRSTSHDTAHDQWLALVSQVPQYLYWARLVGGSRLRGQSWFCFFFIFLMKTRSCKEGSEKFIVKMGGKKEKVRKKCFAGCGRTRGRWKNKTKWVSFG